jgi:hypothetical protein
MDATEYEILLRDGHHLYVMNDTVRRATRNHRHLPGMTSSSAEPARFMQSG